MDKLVFGTDGWRDIIGDKFTFANVGRAAQAYAEHLLDKGETVVFVGHDTRFNGERFARHVAEVMAASGIKVRLSRAFIPTPALSFAVKHYGAGGGVMLTASHNPPAYHGFKLKGPYGGTATQDIYKDVSARVETIAAEDVRAFDAARHTVESFDIRKPYYDALMGLVDVDALRELSGTIIHDSMGGAASGWLTGFAKHAKLKLEVREMHAVPNPMFYGVNPEPIAPNLESLTATMHDSPALFGTATDGDGDRLGLVLPGGGFFNSHQIFAVLLDLMSKKGLGGKVVKTFTVSRIIERLAAARGLTVVETPVGFKHIANAMLQGEVLVGGEESGGIGVSGHIPERDGIANSLLVLEAVARAGKSVAEIFAALEQEARWKHAYDRLDLQLQDKALQETALSSLRSLGSFAGREISGLEDLDGLKLNLSGDAWLLFRGSGTEPLLRIYCEAPDRQTVQEILGEAKRFTDELSAG